MVLNSGGNHDARRENTPTALERTPCRSGRWDLVFYRILVKIIRTFARFYSERSKRKRNQKTAGAEELSAVLKEVS